jgi:RNA polymerase sigma-70 factor (ECF subfamily)
MRSGDEDDAYEPTAVESAPNPALAAEHHDIRQKVESVVAELPPGFAAVIVMKDIRDMQYDEIAESLGCSMGTVKSRLSRARAMVRQRLKPLLA